MYALQVAAVTASLFSLGAGQIVPCYSGGCFNATTAPANATRSVNFKPFRNDTEWTWRVNVTDFYTEEGRRQMHIGYDFSWPGGGSLVSAAKRLNGTYCATAMFSWGTAKNITDKYTEEDTKSTDCTPVLGEACIKAILTSSAKSDDGASQGCWDRLWSQYPECADTFGIEEYSPYGSHGLILQTYDLTSQYTKSGEPFHVITAGGDDSSNDASLPGLYESAVDMLQVVLLRPPLWLPNETWSPTLNCMRVNTNEVADVGSGEGQGGSSGGQGGSEGNKEDDNSAASRDVAGVWALMGSLAVALLVLVC